MKHEDIKKVLEEDNYIGEDVTVCGWIRTIRKTKNMSFIELNDGTSLTNLQIVMENNALDENLKVGASIAVTGKVVKSLNKSQKVEINASSIKVIGKCPNDYPIQKKKQNLESLRDIPHLRVRTNTFNAVFRIRSVIAASIHEYFHQNNFIYINTPILTGSNCEGAGEMFRATTLDLDEISKMAYNPNLNKEDFFGKRMNLTLSGQLEAEAFASGLGKVYTFGPSFRAENSNTKHHAAEFWIIEPEIAFASLDEVVEIVIDIVKYIFGRVLTECSKEVEYLTNFYDSELYNRLTKLVEEDFATLDYTEAIEILKKAGTNFEYPVYWGCDLKSEHIKYLIKVIYKNPLFESMIFLILHCEVNLSYK